MDNFTDTIVAISTPRGIGGLAIIRISGAKATCIADKVFKGKKSLSEIEAQQVIVGQIVEKNKPQRVEKNQPTGQGSVIDEVVVTVFKQPHSYTGEDVVEITCHGGLYVSEYILKLLVLNGARLAEPGEFTLRAFLNGRIDLVQAEAVADLISSRTRQSHYASMQLLTGAISKKLDVLRNQLIEMCSLIELELDFSDEDVEFVNNEKIIQKINYIENEIDLLIRSYQYGRIMRHGVKIAIVGRPNVGKSSLLNAITREDRAIVTELPGTTRDTLTEDIDIKGYLCHLTDTAGFQEPQNIIESEGIKRSEKAITGADIILQVIDGSENLKKEDKNIFSKIVTAKITECSKGARILIIQNKIDLPQKIQDNMIVQSFNNYAIIKVSAKTYTGLEKLESAIVEQIKMMSEEAGQGDITITQIRHRDALIRARESLLKAKQSCESGLSGEFISLDLRESLDALGEILGKVTSSEILNMIFSNFCIGK